MRWYYALSRMAVFGLFLMLFRVRAFGVRKVPLQGGLLLASNHQSFLDPILAPLFLPREAHFMARRTLFRNRAFAALIRRFNAFPVQSGEADLGSVRTTLRLLKDGACVTIFPEASRTGDGRVDECQGGVLVMAQKADVPIVPVAIEGAFEAWPRHRPWPGPRTIWMEYGAPLRGADFRGLTRDEAATLLTRRLRDLHNTLRARMGRAPFRYEDGEHS